MNVNLRKVWIFLLNLFPINEAISAPILAYAIIYLIFQSTIGCHFFFFFLTSIFSLFFSFYHKS